VCFYQAVWNICTYCFISTRVAVYVTGDQRLRILKNKMSKRSFASKRSYRTQIQWRVCFVNFDGSWCSRLRFFMSFLSLFMWMPDSIVTRLSPSKQLRTHYSWSPSHLMWWFVVFRQMSRSVCYRIYHAYSIRNYHSNTAIIETSSGPIWFSPTAHWTLTLRHARSRRQRTESCPRDRLVSQRASSTHCWTLRRQFMLRMSATYSVNTCV
jgi:hypothetical protein